ncbi:PREDICTED: disease resistance protein RGA2-like isoform X2 [Nelumbo nucifera]|uniref:R13L1/DRL21-like LRR repeat region domain-containing protein n=2 Tax=Nelumbo nucifera TaxID=4432 RepID=A0A822Z6L5_NELNU|nr:PREDICTED: disease resistance protein RGA2-like isoform X2 [Nelumbo nucifera]DAD39311.1 TPA_asm: hypothetical protein HUJ06_013634 [Nelumbo nucifera]
MPPGVGKLTKLETLTTFIVGVEEGFRIQELKDLDELRGSLALSNLDNVREESEATDARLNFKKFLRKVEFQWSRLESKAEKTLEKLLPPHQFLTELKILYYGGAKFPSWLGMSKFSSLATISLTNCRKCTQLPTLGKLPWLKSLKLEELHAIEEINHDVFCGHGEFEGFPKLESLEIDGMRRLERWTGMVEGQMPLLRRLIIIDCPSLTILPELLYLHSLQHLKISLCSKLLSLPEEGLPKLVQLLIIMECPELENRCKMGGYNWHKIEHIPNIWIGYRRISGTKPLEQCIAGYKLRRLNSYIIQTMMIMDGENILRKTYLCQNFPGGTTGAFREPLKDALQGSMFNNWTMIQTCLG